VLLTVTLLAATVARSGHELPVYPSYYPHEIEIATLAAEPAGEAMGSGKLQAYIGGAPSPAGGTPAKGIAAVESLGRLVVVRLNPDSPLAGDAAAACAVGRTIVRDIASRAEAAGLAVNPYPVTPWHGDYLHHADRAEAARADLLRGAAPGVPDGRLRVRAEGELAKGLVRPEWLSDGLWDAAIEEVSAAGLVAEATQALNGWVGPAWVRSGWFHAYRLLGGGIADPEVQGQVAVQVARLQSGDYAGEAERINLERELVSRLTSGCRATVAGYTTKREHIDAGFSTGIENIAIDALEGLASPMFLRTVKLKDYPWNGSLQLGLPQAPAAAWNPIGGFTDEFGRLIWFAVGDPAAIPSPYEARWTLNRISEVEAYPRR
jgi:hypothetical protein